MASEQYIKKESMDCYSRREWVSKFGPGIQLKPLNRAHIDVLRRLAGTNEVLSSLDIKHIYYPLANIIMQKYRQFRRHYPAPAVFVVGISGSVAVGKSTGARVLTEILGREKPTIEMITSDNFLKPNQQLEAEGLLRRKGFPESYDKAVIQQFLDDLESNVASFNIPTYDHIVYTILPDKQSIHRPDILILEGVNVLQHDTFPLDFKIYFDAQEQNIKNWYTQRFLLFRDKAFALPGAYFERYATLTDEQATQVAHEIWDTINSINLQKHIAPTCASAQCVLVKNEQHKVQQLYLDKMLTEI